MAIRNAINLGTHLRGGEEGVAPLVHRRAAGVRSLAAKSDRMAFNAKGSQHGSERQILFEQYRPLLDVEFDVCGSAA